MGRETQPPGWGKWGFFEPFGRLLAERVSVRPGERVLDLAAGSGTVSVRLAEAGGCVVAVDPSAQMLRRLAGVAPPEALQDIATLRARALQLPFRDATFGVATCGFGIGFFRNQAGALAELRRVLRADSRVALSWWLDGRNEAEDTPRFAAGRILDALRPPGAAPDEDAPPPWQSALFGELRDPTVALQRVQAAGFADARIECLTVEWPAETFDLYWKRVAAQTREWPAALQEQARQQVAVAVARWLDPGGVLRYPIYAYAIVAGPVPVPAA